MKIIVDGTPYTYSLKDLIKKLGITKMGVIKKLRKHNVNGILLPGQRLYTEEDFKKIS